MYAARLKVLLTKQRPGSAEYCLRRARDTIADTKGDLNMASHPSSSLPVSTVVSASAENQLSQLVGDLWEVVKLILRRK